MKNQVQYPMFQPNMRECASVRLMKKPRFIKTVFLLRS